MIPQIDKEALAKLLITELSNLDKNRHKTQIQKVYQISRIFDYLFNEMIRAERIHFSTLFSKISFIGLKYKFSRDLLRGLHHFRRAIEKPSLWQKDEDSVIFVYELSKYTLIHSITSIFNVDVGTQLICKDASFFDQILKDAEVKEKMDSCRVLLLRNRPSLFVFEAVLEGREDEVVQIAYNIADINDNFSGRLKNFDHLQYPIPAQLLNVEIDENGLLKPRGWILYPDFLVDVTAVAELFKDYGLEKDLHLIKKFLSKPISKYILLGNIANFFLDELMAEPNQNFNDLFPQVFKLDPLTFCCLSEMEVREIMTKSRLHFINLKKALIEDFPKQKITKESVYLEPTFYSNKFGLQGRLDVLSLRVADREASIVELKSGKPFKPNVYGLSHNHYTQTILYDLLLRSAYGKSVKVIPYILYSVINGQSLKYAPPVASQQYEALSARNEIIANEFWLQNLDQEVKEDAILTRFQLNRFVHLSGFAKSDVNHFHQVYTALDELEKAYFKNFVAFIAREHREAKIGMSGSLSRNGQASFWLESLEEKRNKFDLIEGLEIIENLSQESELTIKFKRGQNSKQLSNFRQGDIAVLYPGETERHSVLSTQIFKCSIISIDNIAITVKLRSRQFNENIFKQYKKWNLEHDVMDSGFNKQYRSLFGFCRSAKASRDLFLGRRQPAVADKVSNQLPNFSYLSDDQQQILNKGIQAKERFLLWGPPGTGKTSMMLRAWTEYYLNQTNKKILLLAYTNRAVDEICESISKIANGIHSFIRIGSAFSCAEQFQKNLLQHKIQSIKSRKALLALLDQYQIYVGTISSMMGRSELFTLVNFECCIIDEASQILEPMLAGLLTRVPKSILIGDHLQLPAVVTQPAESTKVESISLKKIGLIDRSMSYFERMMHLFEKRGWHAFYGQLTFQGRMHEEIMKFPSEKFYNDSLKIIPGNFGLRQSVNIEHYLGLADDGTSLAFKRNIFIPIEREFEVLEKVNEQEAYKTATVIHELLQTYHDAGREIKLSEIGIITPFRAQIALIKKILFEENEAYKDVVVDTVERYQGAAKDVIIISLCINHRSQLKSLQSLTASGYDRKMNVALTRARNHLIMIGNPRIMQRSPLYQDFIARYRLARD